MAEESANLMQRIEQLEYRLELVEKVSRPSKLVLRLGLHGTLFRGTLVLMFCHMTAIFACKNFNRAIAQSVEPSEACSGSPAGTGKAFGTQLGVAFLMIFIVVHAWLSLEVRKHMHWAGTLKFMFGEFVGWAFVELTLIALRMIGTGLGHDGIVGHPPIGKAWHADDKLEQREQAWLEVAAFAIYGAAIFVFTLVAFGPGLVIVQQFFYFAMRMPWPLGPFSGARGPCCLLGPRQEAPPRADTDALAVVFLIACLKVSFAKCINGVILGILTAHPLGMVPYGLLELYAVSVCLVGGLGPIHLQQCCPKPLVQFYEATAAALGGMALSAFADGPHGLANLLWLVEGVDESNVKLLGAILGSAVALLCLSHSFHVRITEEFFGCLSVGPRAADAVGKFMCGAGALAFAAVWEGFFSSLVCKLVDEETKTSEKLGIVWGYTAVAWLICAPVAIGLGKAAVPRLAEGERLLRAYREAKVWLPEYEKIWHHIGTEHSPPSITSTGKSNTVLPSATAVPTPSSSPPPLVAMQHT